MDVSKSQLLTTTYKKYIKQYKPLILIFNSVVKYPLIACPSTLRTADKEILKNVMTKIGGQVSRDWSEQCSHLCMNSVTVTEKVNWLYLFNLYYVIILLKQN